MLFPPRRAVPGSVPLLCWLSPACLWGSEPSEERSKAPLVWLPPPPVPLPVQGQPGIPQLSVVFAQV